MHIIGKYLVIVFTFFTGVLSAQIGGSHTFQVLNFNNSARVEALGGYLLGVKDDDANLGQANPALLNPEMHGQVNLNYINYFADANFGYSSYTRHFANVGTFNASILYADYGRFEYADLDGTRNGGTFGARDLVLAIGYGRPISSKFSVGGQFKMIGSFLESYSAFGLALDLGASYIDTANNFGAGLLIKNAGMQLKSYTPANRESLPLNIAIGVSKKLTHAPFRFSLTYDNLQKWNLVYYDENNSTSIDQLTGEIIEIKPPGVLKKFMYHITVGTELILGKNFHIRMGYDHMQRQTMKVGAKPGMAGFSIGLGLKVKSIYFSYGMAKYHIAGTSNQITISKRIGKEAPIDNLYRQFQ
ncbi:MAG: type IX secretion system protein PorQ [Flavobacteriales bacterium]|nr:type IX secretion system protein PorQ [Flavobacteriales bacterium]MCB9195457.1 type IX secretion system protein PorQ [Flavobacteriales bacterium]MCB9198361.1 type IX secretion system protein PorQ [Flavobacteriales bacterium]